MTAVHRTKEGSLFALALLVLLSCFLGGGAQAWAFDPIPSRPRQRQAKRLVENLGLLERPGGLMTSTHESGAQWDAPFGWAPLQFGAVKGLRRYGYHTEANRLTHTFLSLVLQEFDKHGVIFEKYDVVRRTSKVSAGIRFGYSSNETGFGWTNATFVELLHDLKRSERSKRPSLEKVAGPQQ